MSELKKWKLGVADEAWKIHICSRDVARAEDLVSGLSYILASDLGGEFDQKLSVIAKFSGEQIAKALRDYREDGLAGIAKGLSAVREK
jgi:flagellin-specific chaperone FliS